MAKKHLKNTHKTIEKQVEREGGDQEEGEGKRRKEEINEIASKITI